MPNADARTVSAAQPETPTIALQQGISGEVTVKVTLDETSKIIALAVYKSPSALLNSAALNAARQSTFQTRIENCYTVPSDYFFIVDFLSNGSSKPYVNIAPPPSIFVAPEPSSAPQLTIASTPKPRVTTDPFITKANAEISAIERRATYVDTHGWATLSADQRRVARAHGATPAHVYAGLPCHEERYDAAGGYHALVWWYGTTSDPCSMATAYRFLNGTLQSVYQAP